jgi:acyl-CoA thioesterase I
MEEASRMSIRLLLLIACLVTGPAWGGPPVILVLGDSLSANYGFDPREGWVELLRERLREAGHPHQVVNASVSGETTAGGLARLPAALDRHRPDILILELGGNDGLRAFPPERMRDNLARMIELAQTRGADVLLAGMRIPPNYGRAYAEKFHAVYRELAADYGIALVPFLLEGVGGVSALMQPDGIHPAAEAQPIILDNVWPHLRPLLESVEDSSGTSARQH